MAALPTEKKPEHYVTNANLLEAIREAKAENRLTNKLAKMLMMIAERYSLRSNFIGYSYRDDMVASAVANLCANWYKFDEARSSNPFAFYTTSCFRSFIAYLGDEKKQRDIRDSMLIDAGAAPSWSYQERDRETQHANMESADNSNADSSTHDQEENNLSE